MKRSLIATAMTIGVIAVYALRLDDVAGLYKDDAYYMVLAKALANGDGYALISSALTPILPAFPPGFPLLLAPVFAVTPNYPGNLVWLKLISIAAMLGAGVLTYRYFADYRGFDRGKAGTIALLTALLPAFVFLATSTVMAECAFTCAALASAVALERAAQAAETMPARRATLVAGLTTTAAWLIRAPGVAFIGAGALFLLWRRGWRWSLGFSAVCAIAYAPWASYSVSHRSTAADLAAHGGDAAAGYAELLTRSNGVSLPARVTANFVNIFGHDVGAVIFPAGYRDASESGQEVFMLTGQTGLQAGSMGLGTGVVLISTVASLFMLIGFVRCGRRMGVAELFCAFTIAMVLVIPPARTYRYVLPLAPFLVAYFLIGIEAVAARLRMGTGPSAFRVAAGSLLVFLMIEHGQYIWLKMAGPSPPFIQDGREVRLVTDYVNAHLPAGAPVVSTNPGLVYLLTGRKAVAYVDPVANWERWQSAGIHYAVALHVAPDPGRSTGNRMLFQSPRLKLWVVDLKVPLE